MLEDSASSHVAAVSRADWCHLRESQKAGLAHVRASVTRPSGVPLVDAINVEASRDLQGSEDRRGSLLDEIDRT